MYIWKIVASIILLFSLTGCGVKSSLTQEERNYVNTHTVVWAGEDNYFPFVYIDRYGQPNGLTVDYMNLISEKTGLKFRMAKHGQLATILSSLEHGTVEMVTSVRTTPGRAQYSSFTRPYILVDLVLIKKVNVPKTVAVGRGYAAIDYLKAVRKDLEIVEFDDDEKSYQALIGGVVDCAIMDIPSSRWLTTKYGVDFDKSSIPFEYPLSFAVEKDNFILRSILDKAINDISEDEHAGIKDKWM